MGEQGSISPMMTAELGKLFPPMDSSLALPMDDGSGSWAETVKTPTWISEIQVQRFEKRGARFPTSFWTSHICTVIKKDGGNGPCDVLATVLTFIVGKGAKSHPEYSGTDDASAFA